jgi:hypothetical protein
VGNERGDFSRSESFFVHPLPPWGCSIWRINAIALSMGQLPFQISQPCTHNGFAPRSLPFGVMLAMCKAHASRMTFVLGRYYPNDTGLTQKEQFNRLVLEQGIARQTLGRSLTLAHNVVREVL